MEPPGLLVDDPTRSGGGAQHREILMLGDPRDVPGPGVVGMDVEFPVPIRAEIDAVADPHGVRVVRAPLRLRHLHDGVIRDVIDPDPRRRPAAVVLPLGEGLVERRVGDLRSVRRIRGLEGVRDRQLVGMSSTRRDGEELLVSSCVGVAPRREEDGRTIGREALHDVRARMPGEPRGHPSIRRDEEHVGISVIFPAEGDPLSVRREPGVELDPDMRGESSGRAPVDPCDPQIPGIGERDPVGAHRRLGEHQRPVSVLGPGRMGGRGAEDGGGEQQGAQLHVFLRDLGVVNRGGGGA